MAETLSEIFNGTLTASDFTNGEATILTTNATTAHVIKDSKVVQGSTVIPVKGDLEVNGFKIASVESDASGTEIIAPNSTLKVKSATFPLAYKDIIFQTQDSPTVINTLKTPTVGGLVDAASEPSTTDITSIPSTIRINNVDSRQLFTGLGPNNNTLVIYDNNNSTTQAYLYNSAGSLLYSAATGYKPAWFDGSQYMYHTFNTTTLIRVDTFTGGSVNFATPYTMSFSTYPKFFGYKQEYAIFWSQHSSTSYRPLYINLQTGVIDNLGVSNTTPDTLFTGASTRFYLSKFSTGEYKIVKVAGGTVLHLYDWTPDAGLSGATQPVSKTIDLVPSCGSTNSHYVEGSIFYYLDSSGNRNIYAYDMERDTTAFVGQIGTDNFNGQSLWGKSATPDQTTIDARTYTVASAAGLSLRLSGVTSTQG
jgi:hypothetical protein